MTLVSWARVLLYPMLAHWRVLHRQLFRAEVRAALEALRIGAMLKCKVRIWCDCQGVVERVTAQPRSETNQRNCKHADLWREVEALLPELGPCGLTITKVATHQEMPLPPFQRWTPGALFIMGWLIMLHVLHFLRLTLLDTSWEIYPWL